jgi:hypothetical protein
MTEDIILIFVSIRLKPDPNSQHLYGGSLVYKTEGFYLLLSPLVRYSTVYVYAVLRIRIRDPVPF